MSGSAMDGTDRDVLITRMLDGEATPEDWTAFQALAARDASVWAELSSAQQDMAEISASVAQATAVAARVRAPVDAGETDDEALREALSVRFSGRVRATLAWSGWAAAAALVLAWGTGLPIPGSGVGGYGGVPSGAIEAGVVPTRLNSAQALDQYLDTGREEGRVIAEMPTKVLLEARPNPEGAGYEVLFYRQILERAVVPELRTLDGLGRGLSEDEPL